MPLDSPDESPRYEVHLTEPAEIEVERAYFGRMQFGERTAEDWYAGLARALGMLSQFPNGFVLAPESQAMGGGVHQMLYGRGRSTYRILYRIVEPREGESGVVRVLHVRHAMQRLTSEPDDSSGGDESA